MIFFYCLYLIKCERHIYGTVSSSALILIEIFVRVKFILPNFYLFFIKNKTFLETFYEILFFPKQNIIKF